MHFFASLVRTICSSALAILLAAAIVSAARAQESDLQKPSSEKSTAPSSQQGVDRAGRSSAKIVEEPPVYYVRDKDGHLVPLLGFSYEELLQFLKLKQADKVGDADSAGFALEQLVLDGEVRGDVAELTTTYKIQLRSNNWVTVPLASDGPILREIVENQGGAEHRVDFDREAGKYTVLLKGAAGAEQKLTAKFAVPVKLVAGQTQLAMSLPSTAASQLTLRVPTAAIEVTNHSGISLASAKSGEAGKESQINCLGLNGPVVLAWRSPSAEGGSSSLPLDATGQILVRIDSRRVQFDCHLTVSSLGAPFDKCRVKLPPEAELLTPANEIGAYAVSSAGNLAKGTVEIQLPRRTTGPVEIHLQAERPYDVTQSNQQLELAGFAVLEALPHRQSGQLAVAIEGDWQLNWVQQNRVRQIEELDPPLRDKSVIAGFEYFGQPASLVVRVTPRKTRVIVEPEYQCFVDTHQARLQATLKYSIRGAKSSALEIAMPGWEIDELRPAGIVDADSIPPTGLPVSTIQLTQPLLGELELTLKAHRDLPTNAGRIDLPLPMPTADVVGPAILAILPADNVRLRPRDSDTQGLVRITIPPRMKLPVQQQPPLFYRAEQLPAVFVADLERIPQSVSTSVESTLTLHRDAIQMEQRFRYKVEHESLSSISLDVPVAVLNDADLQFEFDGQMLPPLLPPVTDPDASVVTIDVPLPNPQLGTFEVVARYRLPQTSPVGQIGSFLTAPLLMPTSASVTSNNLSVIGDLASRVQPHDELWTIVDEPQDISSMRPGVKLAAGQATTDISLAFTQNDSRDRGATVVQRRLATNLDFGEYQAGSRGISLYQFGR